jgi:hypothetical protein
VQIEGGFVSRVLPYRERIKTMERKTKREKERFSLER